jgi:hypothetical protein
MCAQRAVRRQAKRSPKDPWPAVQAAIRKLREAHKIGRRILDEAGLRAEYGKHGVREIAKEYSLGEEGGRNLRRFAATYSKDELDQLCGLCRDHRRSLGIWSAFKFLTIPDRRKREAFAKDAIAGHWSYTRIERELRHRFNRESRPRGRKPRLPDSQGAAIVQIAELSNGFVRFAMRLQNERPEWLTAQVGRELVQAVAALEALQASAARSLARSQAGQSRRSRLMQKISPPFAK